MGLYQKPLLIQPLSLIPVLGDLFEHHCSLDAIPATKLQLWYLEFLGSVNR